VTELLTGLSQEVVSGIALGCIYALVALGFTLIYRATEVVNFAQGELMMVGAYVNFFLVSRISANLGITGAWMYFIAFMGALLFAIIFGIILDLVINRPLRDQPVFSVIMATISISIILRALVAMIAGPFTHIQSSPFGDGVVSFNKIAISVQDVFIIFCAIVLVILFYIFFRKSRWGVAMQATSADPTAAQLMGIPVKKVYRLVWIFATLVATVGGILLAPKTLLDTNIGFIGLKAFPAAVLGGFGSVPGAIFGGVILGIIETISAGTLSYHFAWIKEINDVIPWLVLIAVLMVKPDGIFGIAKVKKV